jgi:hypothetical protein
MEIFVRCHRETLDDLHKKHTHTVVVAAFMNMKPFTHQ